MITRPMKAETITTERMEDLVWPAWCSPKIDGLRLMIHPTIGPITSGFKLLPNLYVRGELEKVASLSDLDAELYSMGADGTALFNRTQSDMMSRDGEPNWRLAVFDCFANTDWGFTDRHHQAISIVKNINHPNIKVLTHTLISSLEEFVQYIEVCMEDGYEGAIYRSPAGPWKNGRSTFNQGWMLKWKPWEDAEGTIIGFEELMHNENPLEESRHEGLTTRSSHKAGKVGGNTLGKFILQTEWGELRVGTGVGLTHELRQEIWNRNPGAWASTRQTAGQYLDQPGGVEELMPDIGRKITFKYMPFGMQDKPRHPIYKGFRDD